MLTVANKVHMKSNRFTIDDVDVTGKSSNHDGFFNLDTYTLKHKQFAGGWSDEVCREIFERGHAVAVLPFDPIRDEVILIEQFRPGAYFAMDSPWFTTESSPWLIETVAGIIEPGERPEDVAMREAVEETGVAVTELIPVCHYLVSPGGTTESVFVFIGKADTSNVNGLHGIEHEGEDIRPFAEPLTDAYDGISNGQIVNGMTIIVLQWLMLNKAEVISTWNEASR